MERPQGHATMPATPHCRGCCLQGGCQGWSEPSLHRPPGGEDPPELGCIPDLPPLSLRPPPLRPPSLPSCGCTTLSALCLWYSYVEWTAVPCRPLSFLLPPSPVASVLSATSVVIHPSLPPAAACASLSPLLPPCSAPHTIGSGERRCHTTPDIDMSHRCERPCITHIARSCTLTPIFGIFFC